MSSLDVTVMLEVPVAEYEALGSGALRDRLLSSFEEFCRCHWYSPEETAISRANGVVRLTSKLVRKLPFPIPTTPAPQTMGLATRFVEQLRGRLETQTPAWEAAARNYWAQDDGMYFVPLPDRDDFWHAATGMTVAADFLNAIGQSEAHRLVLEQHDRNVRQMFERQRDVSVLPNVPLAR